MGQYDDILRLSRPESTRRPKMPIPQRAKQFMPFATLKGYGDAIEEKGVQYDTRAARSDDDADALDQALRELAAALTGGEAPRVGVVAFEPVADGDRGFCRTHSGTLEKLTPDRRSLRVDGRDICFDDIIDLWREDEP